MINQRNRFHGHASLKYVLANGKQARNRELSIKFVDNRYRKYSRVAIIISKKVLKHAVDRNCVRRRLYEIMRQRIDHFNRVIDITVIVYRPEVLDMPHDQLVREIDECLTKLGVIGSQDSATGDKI